MQRQKNHTNQITKKLQKIMKHLKMSMYLLLTAAIFTGCEKETTPLSEEPAMNVQEIKAVNPQGPMSMLDLINSGIDLKTYFNSLPKQENTSTRPAYSKIPNPNLQFYYSAENAACSNLSTENFDLTSGLYNYCSISYLDENTDTGYVLPGDILPGISFEVVRNDYDYISNTWWGDYYSDSDLTNMMNECGLYVNYGYNGGEHILQSNYEFTDLIIHFSGNNINNISMDLFNWLSGNEIIEIYGASDNLLGTDVVYVNYNNVTFWGIQSLVPISKIVIKSEYSYGFEGIDNISFGTCDDFDGDGVLNANDAHPNSDFRRGLIFGGIRVKIDNKMVKNGSTMMDQINDLIAQTNSQYNGQNYDYLHKRFMTELSQITYYWIKARLITATQRSQISSIAWGATIPYMYN